MKVSVVAALIALSDLAAAWISCPRPSHHTALRTYSSLPTVLQASRRELIAGAFLASLAAAPQLALADLDYSKIQDLLGNDSSTSYVPEPGKRPSYLTEPTNEFKESEAKSAEFKRKNLQKKQEFAKLLSIIADAPNEEQLLSGALNDMGRFVQANAGLPIGITKDEVVKACRRRKAKKYWPTSVEVAYQDLLIDIAYSQSPNTDREMSKL